MVFKIFVDVVSIKKTLTIALALEARRGDLLLRKPAAEVLHDHVSELVAGDRRKLQQHAKFANDLALLLCFQVNQLIGRQVRKSKPSKRFLWINWLLGVPQINNRPHVSL